MSNVQNTTVVTSDAVAYTASISLEHGIFAKTSRLYLVLICRPLLQLPSTASASTTAVPATAGSAETTVQSLSLLKQIVNRGRILFLSSADSPRAWHILLQKRRKYLAIRPAIWGETSRNNSAGKQTERSEDEGTISNYSERGK